MTEQRQSFGWRRRTPRAPLLAAAGLCAALFFVSQRLPESSVQDMVVGLGHWGPVLLIALLLTTNVIAPLTSSPIILAGFYAYGSGIVVCAATASWLSYSINFWLSRKFGRPIVRRLVGGENVRRVDNFAHDYGWWTLLILRIFESEFNKLVSYAAGLTSMPFATYLVVSSCGMIPGVAFWYWLSSATDNPLVFTAATQTVGLTLAGAFLLTGSGSGRLRADALRRWLRTRSASARDLVGGVHHTGSWSFRIHAIVSPNKLSLRRKDIPKRVIGP